MNLQKTLKKIIKFWKQHCIFYWICF